MTITKVWLEEQIQNEVDAAAKTAYQRCYTKLTEPPSKIPKDTTKPFDHNKTYDSVFQFYLKTKTPEEAHEIAAKVVREQQEKHSQVELKASKELFP